MIKNIWKQIILLILRLQGEADTSRYKVIKTKNDILVSLRNEVKNILQSRLLRPFKKYF